MARARRPDPSHLESLELGPVFGVSTLPSSIRLRRPPRIELVSEPPRDAEPFPNGMTPSAFPAIAWAFDRRYLESRAAGDWPRGAPTSTLLRDYRALVTATDEEILAFACKYGVLGVCPHRCKPILRFWHNQDGSDCYSAGISDQPTVAIEPIAKWRQVARMVDAALSVREHLSAGRDAHGAGVGVLWRAEVDANDRPDLPGIQKSRRDVAMNLALEVTNLFLGATRLRPEVWYDPEALDSSAFTTVLVPGHYPFIDRLLFPVLAQQLAGVIVHPKRAFICARCDKPFYPERRAPQEHRENRRPLCTPCKPLAKREKQAEAKQKKRASRAVSNPVSNDRLSEDVSIPLSTDVGMP